MTAVSTLADANGPGPFAYQWFRTGTEIPGATAAQYTAGDHDVSAIMTVHIRYVDGAGFNEQATSSGLGPIGRADSGLAYAKRVFFANPASNTEQQSLVPIINDTDQTGSVVVSANDDLGVRPINPFIAFDMAPFESKLPTAADLENGNPAKGLSSGFGTDTGRWQVTASSDLDLKVQNLILTRTGLLTNLSAVVPTPSRFEASVLTFNPSSNTQQRSRLRVVNKNDHAGSILISGFDDAGQPAPGGTALINIAAHAVVELTGLDLEHGNSAVGLQGTLGYGEGKWRLSLSAVDIKAQSLLETPSGFLTNLSSPVQ